MIVTFYLLYIWITPANWSWIWFLIALAMQFIDFSSRQFQRLVDNETNYWKGPYA